MNRLFIDIQESYVSPDDSIESDDDLFGFFGHYEIADPIVANREEYVQLYQTYSDKDKLIVDYTVLYNPREKEFMVVDTSENKFDTYKSIKEVSAYIPRDTMRQFDKVSKEELSLKILNYWEEYDPAFGYATGLAGWENKRQVIDTIGRQLESKAGRKMILGDLKDIAREYPHLKNKIDPLIKEVLNKIPDKKKKCR